MVATRIEQAFQSHARPAPTREMADWIAGLTHADITTQALTWAKHAVLDWLGVTIAGAHEPLSDMLIADALSEGAAGSAHLMGRPERTIPSQAALINGSASHALDYDDVHLGLNGHPTAPILPALLALAEQRGSTGREVLTALYRGLQDRMLHRRHDRQQPLRQRLAQHRHHRHHV